MLRLIRRLRPAITVWYHQHAGLVDDAGRGDRAVPRRYARLVGLPFRPFGTGLPGLLTGWQEDRFPATTPFVVELPAGRLSGPAARRHARAVIDAAARPS
jgi:hypothetical protein